MYFSNRLRVRDLVELVEGHLFDENPLDRHQSDPLLALRYLPALEVGVEVDLKEGKKGFIMKN